MRFTMVLAIGVATLLLSGCATMQIGSPKAQTTATEAAAGATSQGANKD